MSQDLAKEYTELVEAIKADMNTFIEDAEMGYPHMKKGAWKALSARKLSSKITKDLKEYRKLSVSLHKKKDDSAESAGDTPLPAE